MRSPFPGMDPYLENFWRNVHGKLIAYLSDELNEVLPPNYRAAMDERIVIGQGDQQRAGARFPDVAVIDWPDQVANPAGVPGRRSQTFLVEAPEIIEYDAEPETEYFIEIVDSQSNDQVITAIEVLSPANKRSGDGRTQVKQKQSEYRAGRVNRVEIDLLRAGRRVFDFSPDVLRHRPSKPYYVVICWGDRPGKAGIHAIDLRDALPAIGIPLRPGEADVPIALQPLMDRVYRNGRFPIDYSKPPEPPLEGSDADWARELLAASRG